MTDATILDMTKANLQILKDNTLQDEYLQMLITSAREMIAREGITLNDSIEDGNLVVMYAAYLYRKRADGEPVMPRMLRYALNNRLFSQKVRES